MITLNQFSYKEAFLKSSAVLKNKLYLKAHLEVYSSQLKLLLFSLFDLDVTAASGALTMVVN